MASGIEIHSWFDEDLVQGSSNLSATLSDGFESATISIVASEVLNSALTDSPESMTGAIVAPVIIVSTMTDGGESLVAQIIMTPANLSAVLTDSKESLSGSVVAPEALAANFYDSGEILSSTASTAESLNATLIDGSDILSGLIVEPVVVSATLTDGWESLIAQMGILGANMSLTSTDGAEYGSFVMVSFAGYSAVLTDSIEVLTSALSAIDALFSVMNDGYESLQGLMSSAAVRQLDATITDRLESGSSSIATPVVVVSIGTDSIEQLVGYVMTDRILNASLVEGIEWIVGLSPPVYLALQRSVVFTSSQLLIFPDKAPSWTLDYSAIFPDIEDVASVSASVVHSTSGTIDLAISNVARVSDTSVHALTFWLTGGTSKVAYTIRFRVLDSHGNVTTRYAIIEVTGTI